jgi:hypothetical protein
MKAKNQYTEDYKEQALVKVYNRGDRTIQSIAEELRILINLNSDSGRT